MNDSKSPATQSLLTSSVVGDWLRARARATPDRTAILLDDQLWSYDELDRLVDRLCGKLRQLGVQPSDHVALRLPNSLSFVVAVHAAARLGAVLVPLNLRLTSGELAHQLDKANCRWLLGQLPAGADVAALTVIPLPACSGDLLDWLPDAVPNAPAPHSYALDSVQAVVFTSGTTGFPKGAMLTFANHLWSALGSAFRLGSLPDDRWLVCLPLYHVGGLSILFRSCLYGTTAVIQSGFNPHDVDRALREQQISLVSLVPTMLQRLLAGRDQIEWPSLRLILLGGAAASDADLARAARFDLPIVATYGLTECASQVATQDVARTATGTGSAGRPLLFTTVEIETESGGPASADEPGEIIVSGPTVMAGYYGDAAATQAVLRHGRLLTGDIGYIDGDGDLWVLGRRTDLIVSGGENVYPAEVERVLRAHEAVDEATVVGLPDAEWGQLVAAMIVPRPGVALDRTVLERHIRTQIAGYKVPRVWHFAPELPFTASGKVHREQVVAALIAHLEATHADA